MIKHEPNELIKTEPLLYYIQHSVFANTSQNPSFPGEARLVVEYLSGLKEAGVSEGDMAVITPYNLQIEFIRTQMMGSFKEV